MRTEGQTHAGERSTGRLRAVEDGARGRLTLPTPEQVAMLPSVEKARIRGELLVLLAVSLTEPTPPSDPALTPAEAARVLGRSVDWLRRAGPGWHETLRDEFGLGFLMQPVANGDVRYSLAGLELLKAYWRGQRAPTDPD